MSNEPPPRMLCVFDRRRCVGFLLRNCRGAEAFDADGEALGLFPSPEKAAEIVRKAAAR
jgi:hypothetical protein